MAFLIDERRCTSPISNAQVSAVIGPIAGILIRRATRSVSRPSCCRLGESARRRCRHGDLWRGELFSRRQERRLLCLPLLRLPNPRSPFRQHGQVHRHRRDAGDPRQTFTRLQAWFVVGEKSP